MAFALTYLGHVLDAFDEHYEARAARVKLVRDIRAGKLPDFLDADDIDGESDFPIVEMEVL